jgi:hypothetical protein
MLALTLLSERQQHLLHFAGQLPQLAVLVATSVVATSVVVSFQFVRSSANILVSLKKWQCEAATALARGLIQKAKPAWTALSGAHNWIMRSVLCRVDA